jgi:hypothetical protein
MQANVVGQQLLRLGLQKLLEQRHQGVHFHLGALPVFGRKSVERQVGNADFAAGFDGRANGIRPLLVTFDPVQQPLFGPAAIAIHDDGHVPGQPFGIEGGRFRRRPIRTQ